jgi:hypothetical protein
MIEGAIQTLILICVVVLIVYIALWVLSTLGVPLPEQVVKVLWVIVALVCLLLILRFLLPALGVKYSMGEMLISSAEAKRSHVYIHKRSPAPRPMPAYDVPLIAVPPAAVAFDLVRRTSCDPNIARSTGKGDPGFDLVNGPLYGNFLIPAIYRKECLAQPK